MTRARYLSIILVFTLLYPVGQGAWWDDAPQPLRLPEPAAGACYPWIILSHHLYNVETGATIPGTGGDAALRVECYDDYFIVYTMSGAYVFDKAGALRRIVVGGEFGECDQCILVVQGNTTILKTPVVQADIPVVFPGEVVEASAALYDKPYVVAAVRAGDRYEYYFFDGELRFLGAGDAPAVLVAGERLLIAANQTLFVYDVDNLGAVRLRPLPYQVLKLRKVGERVYGITAHGVVSVDEARFIGDVEVTPAGYYIPETQTTYVRCGDTYTAVPGKAVGVFGALAVTTIGGGEGRSGALWPLKTAVLVAKRHVDGVLFIPDRYVVRVSLPPGVWRLPAGAVLRLDNGKTLMVEGEVVYPPAEEQHPPAEGIILERHAAVFPESYRPVAAFENVTYVAAGGGRVLLITPGSAVVYSEYGVTARIPGPWKYGGLGECIALYDGAGIYVYDLAGNPAAYMNYYLENPPISMYCDVRSGEPVVLVYYDGVVYELAATRQTREEAGAIVDPSTGLQLVMTKPPRLAYGGAAVSIPSEPHRVHINKYWAAWTANNTVSILRLDEGSVYTFIGPLPGANETEAYPLSGYLILYNRQTGVAEVLPYAEWLMKECYLEVITDPDATIKIDGEPVAAGHLKLYVKCGTSVRVSAEKPYHKPDERTVVVKGPTTLELRPKPRIARVTLAVVGPENLTITEATLRIDNETVTWRNNEAKEFVAGKPYRIRLEAVRPVDACKPIELVEEFEEGDDTLVVPCQLKASVIMLYTGAPVLVKVHESDDPGTVKAIVSVRPGQPSYVVVDAGEYILVAEPSDEENYMPRKINVTVPANAVVPVDVTPLRYGRIVVNANVASARITVSPAENASETVAEGLGSIDARVRPGTYQVLVTATGYAPYSDTVDVPPGETVEITAVLTPVAQQPAEQPEPVWERTGFQAALTLAVLAAALAALYIRHRRRHAASVVAEAGEAGEGGEPA